MKVCFVYLPHPYLNQPDAQIPIGLLYLAAVLEKNNIEVNVKNYSSYLTYQAITYLPQADVYGITCTSMELPQANRFAHLIKEKYPEAKVGLGGPGTITDEFVDYNAVDFICKGEGEITILKILKDVEMGNLKRVYIGEPVKDLNSLPMPAYHLLGGNLGGNIFAYNKRYRKGGTTVILTTRGCPYKCSFCSSPHLTKLGGGVRYRSADSVYNEMRYLKDEYGIEQFRISDDMFTANIGHVKRICKKIKELDIVWRISCRTKPFTYEMAKIIWDAGCVEASFGVESFDDDVLKVLNKKATAEDNVKALKICEKVGIKTRILFMIRTPGQTEKTVDINIKSLEKLPYNIIACTSFVPIPGSDIWYNPDKYNIEILNRNLDNYNFYFYGSHGRNKLESIIKIKDRSLEEFNKESESFRKYIEKTGKLNKG